MHNEIFDRAEERIRSFGLSNYTTERKLAEYAVLRENNTRGVSSLTVAEIAEDLMTSFTWVATGERYPFELRSTAQNVLSGPENDEPGSEWLVAKNVLSDIATAYEQVAIGPSENFKWNEPQHVGYAEEKIRQLGDTAQEMSFFELVEECFGVEIIVLDRPEHFTAIGAMIGGAPIIVVKQGLGTDIGHYAVATELGKIMAGNLYWYSDVFEYADDWDPWVLDFTGSIMNSDTMDALMVHGVYANRRFPKRLVEAHRRDVAAGKNLGYFLEWMEK